MGIADKANGPSVEYCRAMRLCKDPNQELERELELISNHAAAALGEFRVQEATGS